MPFPKYLLSDIIINEQITLFSNNLQLLCLTYSEVYFKQMEK